MAASKSAFAFHYVKGVAFRFEYTRTLDHLKAWKLILPPHIKEATISFNPEDKGHVGMKIFTLEHVPQLKYHNPNVSFTIIPNKPTECAIKLTQSYAHNKTKRLTGKDINICGKDKESRDIKRDLELTVVNGRVDENN